MYRPSFKSVVSDNQNPFMWCNKDQINRDDIIDACSIPNCIDSSEVKAHSNQPTAVVVVEPRTHEHNETGTPCGDSDATSSSRRIRPEWFMLPHSVDLNNDVLRLVSSLSTVVQILTRMTNAATQELGQHPEREQGFEGLRMLLNYADLMYTTLLQPQPYPSERLSSSRNPNTQSYSLFHHLFEPSLGIEDTEEQLPSARSNQLNIPYRVAAISTGLPGPATTDLTTASSGAPDASDTNST